MQRIFAKWLGLGFWLAEHYPQAKWIFTHLGTHMHNASWEGFNMLQFAYMHLIEHPIPHRFGHPDVRSLELPGIVRQPILDNGRPDTRHHVYCDASVQLPKNVTHSREVSLMY